MNSKKLEAKYQKKLATKFWKLPEVNPRKIYIVLSMTRRPHYSLEINFHFSDSDLKPAIDIDFGDIFWLKTIDFWTDSLQNHDYIGHFDRLYLRDHRTVSYVLIRDRY